MSRTVFVKHERKGRTTVEPICSACGQRIVMIPGDVSCGCGQNRAPLTPRAPRAPKAPERSEATS